MHYAEWNSRFLEAVKEILRGKGYKVSGTGYDSGDEYFLARLIYYVEGRSMETEKDFHFPYNSAMQPNDSNEEIVGKEKQKSETLLAVAMIPDAKHAMNNYLLSLIEKIREAAPDANLPQDFLNPIEDLADKLRHNILENHTVHLEEVTEDETPY